MIELDAVIGALVGLITGATPSVVSAVWKECRQRRIDRGRQLQREHEERMQRMQHQRETIQTGMERLYRMDASADSVSYHPPETRDQ